MSGDARALTAAILVLAVAGAGREAWFHFHVEPDRPVRHLDQEYSDLLPLLPRQGEAGYVSDISMAETRSPSEVNEEGKGRYLETQYAVAPLILRFGDASLPLVVVHFEDRAALQPTLDAHRLVLAGPVGRHTALARPR